MRYNHFDMLPEKAFQPVGKRMTLEGGGAPSPSPSTTQVQNTNIPEYAQPYVETMLGSAQKQVYNMNPQGQVTGFKPYVPYSTNPADYIANYSPLQQQSYTAAGQLQTPGQFQAGSQLAGAGGLGALGTAGQVANVGQNYYGMATNPYAVGAFMNPYLQQSLQPQLNEIARQGQIQGQQIAGQATAAGAFGGTRSALAQNEAARNALMAQQQAIGQGYNQAYQQAQQAMQYGAGLGLQGQQAALQGYGQAAQAGQALGQLGTEQQAAQQANINLQNTLGLQQQTQQQNIINQAIQNYATAQQYPMQQLSAMSSLLRGLPLEATTTQTYKAQPSALSQLAGIGTGIAGAAKLLGNKGGLPKDFETKKMAGGGITSLENRQRLAEKLSPKQLDVVIANRTIPQDMGMELKQDTANMAQRAAMADAAAKVAQQQALGIEAAPTNLPAEGMAHGGIVAFAKGGDMGGEDFGVKDPSTWDDSDYKIPYDFGITDASSWEDKAKEDKGIGAPNLGGYIGDVNKAFAQGESALAGLKGYQGRYSPQLNQGLGLMSARAMGKGPTFEEAQAQAGKAYEGEAYGDYEKSLKEHLAGVDRQKEQALGSSLLQLSKAFLTNPSFAEGLGQGLGAFGEKYGAEMKEIEKSQREDQKGLAEIMQARRLEAQGKYKEATRLYERGQDKREEAQDKLTTTLGNLNAQDVNKAVQIGTAQANMGVDKAKTLANIGIESAKLNQAAAQANATLKMYNARIAASDAATKAKWAGVVQKAQTDLTKDPAYQTQLQQLLKKYEGNAQDPNYQRDAANLRAIAMHDRLSELMGNIETQGLGMSGAQSADSLLAD